MQVHVREFTDPGCPFAFPAEPAIWRLRWLYRDQLEWEKRMVVLSESPEDHDRRGFAGEKFSAGLRDIQGRYGMPIDPRLRPYTCPSFEFTGPEGRRIDSPGFQPVEVYEGAITTWSPGSSAGRRPSPSRSCSSGHRSRSRRRRWPR